MHVEISIHFKRLLVEVFINVMKDELFSDDSRGRQEILMCLAAHSEYFSPVVIFAR